MSHPEKIKLAVVQVASIRLGSTMSALLKHVLPGDWVNEIQTQHNQDQEWV